MKKRLDDGSDAVLARLREQQVLDDADWARVQGWLEEAARIVQQARRKAHGQSRVFDLDADPRTAARAQIERARRLAGQRLPGWVALWLWRLGQDRGPEFWAMVGRAAGGPRRA